MPSVQWLLRLSKKPLKLGRAYRNTSIEINWQDYLFILIFQLTSVSKGAQVIGVGKLMMILSYYNDISSKVQHS